MSNDIDYGKLDEGLGGCYERLVITNIIKRLAKVYECKSILELNATYIAGIPGFNSCPLVQSGYDVTITVNDRDYLDTLKAWDMVGLKTNILNYASDTITPFADNQFDIVWNHLAFEQYRHPEKLVNEMKRISNKLVINLTLNPWNYGYIIHWFNHKLRRDPWNHGYFRNTTTGAVKRAHEQEGLRVIEVGSCDSPPFMDTVNAIIGNSMTYGDILPQKAKDKWVWCSAKPGIQGNRLIRMLMEWEDTMPAWFKVLASHHLYVASMKNE